jgi:hypothetical protein
MKKDLFLITAYTPDDQRKDLLRNFVSSIDKEMFDVMVVSHSSIPEDVINNINYFIYDSSNVLLTGFEHKYIMFYESDKFTIHTTENRPFNHFIAAWKLVTLGLTSAKNEGYKKVHCIEYDTELFSANEFIENSSLLDRHSLVYYSTNYQPSIISFPISFHLDKINEQWFICNEKDLKNQLSTGHIKTIEDHELKILANEPHKLPKSHNLLLEKDIKINKYYSGGEDIWVTPVVDKNNNLIVFSYNPPQHLTKKDILIYNIKILVNDEFHKSYDNKLRGWHLTFVENFDKIEKLTIIRNNKKIVNYDFNKIDKEKFKQVNRYEIK